MVPMEIPYCRVRIVLRMNTADLVCDDLAQRRMTEFATADRAGNDERRVVSNTT